MGWLDAHFTHGMCFLRHFIKKCMNRAPESIVRPRYQVNRKKKRILSLKTKKERICTAATARLSEMFIQMY